MTYRVLPFHAISLTFSLKTALLLSAIEDHLFLIMSLFINKL